MLLHLHPVNLILQMAIMAATSMVFLAHMWDWHGVNEAL